MFRILSISFIIFICLLTACSSKKTEGPATQEEVKPIHGPDVVLLTTDQFATVGVQLGGITQTNLSNYIKASGSIYVSPQQLISITSPYGGIIKSTPIQEGRFIGKGGVVATLENPEFLQIQQDYLESASQLTFLQQELTRQQELVNENIAARKSLQKATSEYNSMAARVEGLKAKLRVININPSSISRGNFTSTVNIYTPQGGYVTRVYSNIGKYINANETVADLANTQNMLVKINVFEKDIPKINLGQKIRFTATGDSTERLAIVELMGKDIHEDRIVEVQGRITTHSPKLLPGMFVNAIVEVGEASTPALPKEAVVQAGDKSYIFVLEESKARHAQETEAGKGKKEQEQDKESAQTHYAFRRVEVGIGVTENGYTAVVLPENFKQDSKVVVKGAYDLLSKMNNAGEED